MSRIPAPIRAPGKAFAEVLVLKTGATPYRDIESILRAIRELEERHPEEYEVLAGLHQGVVNMALNLQNVAQLLGGAIEKVKERQADAANPQG